MQGAEIRITVFLRGLTGHLQATGREPVYGKAVSLPFRETEGITIYIFITEFDSHTGCGVAADSGQARSVKHNEPVFVRAQEFFKGGRFLQAGKPGRLHGKIHGPVYMAGPEFPFLPGVYHQ